MFDQLLRLIGMYHAMTWPQISFVAEDHKGRIVGYVLAKMCVYSQYVLELLSYSEICTEMILQKMTRTRKHMDTSILYQFYGLTGVWDWQRNLCFYHVRFQYLWILISTIKSLCRHLSEEAMASIYKASYVSLHVRKSNKAAIALYRDTLGFEVAKIEKKYCKPTTSST